MSRAPEARLREAQMKISRVINGNQVRGEHMARAKLIEEALDGLIEDVKEFDDA